MATASEAERAVLHEEFQWLLREEVHSVLSHLQDILKEGCKRFVLPGREEDCQVKQENFILGSSTSDAVKGVLTLNGDTLCQADLHIKLLKANQMLHTVFREDKQWKMQQVQDAGNHLHQAYRLVNSKDQSYQFKTGTEVNKLMDAVMLQLNRARNRLATPAAMTLPDLANGSAACMFNPALPQDLLVNFYIHHNKLCLVLYQVHTLQPNANKNFKPSGGSVCHAAGSMFEFMGQKYEVIQTHKVESVVPWLGDGLLFLTLALQLCQQLKDKVSVFSNYWTQMPPH